MTDQPKLTPEQATQIIDAIQAGHAIVCYAKCWPCQFGQCTDEPHTWMDDDDREHAGIPASTTAAQLAADKPCGCHCMAERRARLAADQRTRLDAPGMSALTDEEYARLAAEQTEETP